MSSYRPINNLSALEKLVESYILYYLEEFYDKNDILDKNHHGGRKKHSTLTATTVIYDAIYKNDDISKHTILLATDLSSAYDTIYTEIILEKLEHYGIRGGYNDLFRSYYSNRKQFVKIDNACSTLRDCNECSVVHGSRLSGIMYNTYSNEIPKLP